MRAHQMRHREASNAHVRYLARGRPAWRISVVFQDHAGLHRDAGCIRVTGSRADLDALPNQLPIWGISLVLAGSASATDQTTQQTIDMRPGDWLHFAGRHGDAIRLTAGAGFQEMCISTDLELGGMLDALGLWPLGWHGSADPRARIAAVGRELHQALLDPVIPDGGVLRRLIDLIDLTRCASLPSGTGDGFCDRACRLLASHPQPAFAISQAAKAMSLTEQAFRKRFHRAVGMPPGRWHLLRRMELASSLLASASVTEVATQLGYGDLGTFSRQFRSVTGINPRQLRRR